MTTITCNYANNDVEVNCVLPAVAKARSHFGGRTIFYCEHHLEVAKQREINKNTVFESLDVPERKVLIRVSGEELAIIRRALRVMHNAVTLNVMDTATLVSLRAYLEEE